MEKREYFCGDCDEKFVVEVPSLSELISGYRKEVKDVKCPKCGSHCIYENNSQGRLAASCRNITMKWCVKFQELAGSGQRWGDNETGWNVITVYANTKKDAIAKALQLCNNPEYDGRTLYVTGKEIREQGKSSAGRGMVRRKGVRHESK